MLNDLYSEKLLEAAASIPPARMLSSPDATALKASRVCGSEVEVDLIVTDGVVKDAAIRARACALGQASASMVAHAIVGASVDELYRLRDEMRAMLKNEPPPPEGWAPTGERWAALAALVAIRDYPQRHASTLLVFEAICACLDDLDMAATATADPTTNSAATDGNRR